MSSDYRVQLNGSIQDLIKDAVSLSDLEAIRLILKGNSVIDWSRANFRTMQEADRFLQLHLFDVNDSEDLRRLRYLHKSAVNYLEGQIGLRFPEEIKNPVDIRSIFVAASQTGSQIINTV